MLIVISAVRLKKVFLLGSGETEFYFLTFGNEIKELLILKIAHSQLWNWGE